MCNKKMLILGLDGFCWQVAGRLLGNGRMPTLEHLIRTGASGNLRSIMPFETSPAWAAFQTGCMPHNTGVYSFHTLDRCRKEIRLHSYSDILCPTMLEIMHDSNRKMVSINMPLTSPPPATDAVVIPGLLCTSLSPETVTPRTVYADFIKPHPRYQAVNNAHCSTLPEFVHQSCETEQLRCQIALQIMERYPWDVFYFQIQSTDLIQHRYWWALDPGASGYSDDAFQSASIFYQSCDDIIGRLIEKAGPDTAVCIVSDHGFTQQRYALALNRWLMQKQYLVLRQKEKTRWETVKEQHVFVKLLAEMYGRMKKSGRYLCQAVGNLYSRHLAAPFSELELAHLRQFIDLEKTKAFCLGSMGALIYANKDLPNADEVIHAIRENLLEEFGPLSPLPLIRTIKTGADEYGESKTGAAVPDLVVEYYEGISTVLSPWANEIVKCYMGAGQQPGTHDRDGVFVFNGAGFKQGFETHAEIIDILPTVLAYLQLPVPFHLDGKVLQSVFSTETSVRYKEFRKLHVRKETYSEAEQSEVEKRLADLGYL